MAVEVLPAAQRTTEQLKHLRDLMILIRSRTDATVKGLAVVGTAAVTAIGYTKFADIFPYHGPLWAVMLLVLGVLAMVVAVILMVKRFEDIGATIITTSDDEKTCEDNVLDTTEQTILKGEYNRIAALNEVGSLQAYNARAHRFERIADQADDETADTLRARADAIRAEVLTTQARAVVYLLRHRARKAVFSPWAVVFLSTFVVGWYSTAFAADKLEANRSEANEARKEKAAGMGAAAVTASLLRCRARVEAGQEEPAACAPLAEAVAELGDGSS